MSNMQTLFVDMKGKYGGVLELKDSYGEQRFTDLNDWMSQSYLEHNKDLERSLKSLYNKCCAALGESPMKFDEVYPEYLTTGMAKLTLPVWQLGYTESLHIRGATSAYNVFKCMERDCLNGGNTQKYPIEILPFMGGGQPGQRVEAFSMITSIGSSVVTSAFLISMYILEIGTFDGAVDATHPEQELAKTLKSIMEVYAIYEADQSSLRVAVFKSNKGKIEAGQRPRPTILAYQASYSRVADNVLKQSKTRQTRKQLIMQQVIEHNQMEKVRGSKIKTEEIQALGNVMEQSDWFVRKLKTIFQYQQPKFTSCPMSLLGSKFLSPSYECGIKKDDNPLWYGIYEWSQEKGDAWLRRTDGGFNFRVEECIAKGKKPNLLNQASQYRDSEFDMVWKVACVKVWVWPEATKNNSEARMKELESAWRRGALDDSIRPHCLALRKNFKASDVSWVAAPCQGVGELGELDPMGAAHMALTSAQSESLHSQFKEWHQRLGIEASKHKLWLTEVQAFDSKSESDLMRFRNMRATTKETAVKELTETFYNAQGFDKVEQANTYLATKLTKIADIAPSRSPNQVLRVMWADMSQLGLNHSRQKEDIIKTIKTLLEQHPEVSTAVLGMPNTPEYGKGLKADGVRDANIRDAISKVKTTLASYSGMESRGVQAIIDPKTMYSTERPVTLEFLQILSDQKEGVELKSIFRKGYTWRRYGVPELLKILPRSHFHDWSSKLSAASRGNLGEDKERKSWNSGRLLYKTILQFIFSGMGLTPGARVVIQHITSWDHELGMACIELNAERSTDMPTFTYVATGWGDAHNIICQNIGTRLADELGHQIEAGKYIIQGYDANMAEPSSASKRPELDDTQFTICRPRLSSKELAIMETELARVKRMFSADQALLKQLEASVEEFNKVHNPSGVPWKEKRPNPEAVAASESASRGVFLEPCTSTTAEDLVKNGAYTFEHTPTAKANLAFKMYIPEDGSKVYIAADDDGVLYFPLGRFMGTFLQGAPAKTAMQGGTQWIEWKYESLETPAVASKKDSSMSGPDVPPPFKFEPTPLKEFFEHLEKIGKTRVKMVSHKLSLNDVGKVVGIAAEETTCLPLPTQAPKKKKNMTLDNIAGYVDIDCIKKSKLLILCHNLVCPTTPYCITASYMFYFL